MNLTMTIALSDKIILNMFKNILKKNYLINF
jgi:hypothetical protein